jgi:hypothetical protein
MPELTPYSQRAAAVFDDGRCTWCDAIIGITLVIDEDTGHDRMLWIPMFTNDDDVLLCEECYYEERHRS